MDVANARTLAILTRAPSAGGKSRLFADLGRPPDRALLEALLLDTLAGAAAPGVRRVIAVTPPSACDEVRAMVAGAGVAVIPQSNGDLGARMRATMADLFAAGAAAVALVGSDLPHITPACVAAAFDRLQADPASLVLGPAADGGYYLVAATRVPDVFDRIAWGGPRVLEQTVHAAAACGLRVHLLEVLADVDTADDLRRVARSGAAPRVTAWLEREMPNAKG